MEDWKKEQKESEKTGKPTGKWRTAALVAAFILVIAGIPLWLYVSRQTARAEEYKKAVEYLETDNYDAAEKALAAAGLRGYKDTESLLAYIVARDFYQQGYALVIVNDEVSKIHLQYTQGELKDKIETFVRRVREEYGREKARYDAEKEKERQEADHSAGSGGGTSGYGSGNDHAGTGSTAYTYSPYINYNGDYYSDPEELYYWNPDDFYDYEDAEDYYYEYEDDEW